MVDSIFVKCGIAGFILAMFCLTGVFFLFEVKNSGELRLLHAPGNVALVREADTGIVHVQADDWEGISYGQGFACAQSRLWQMEKQRRLVKGTLAELFGKDVLVIDEFMRHVGLERASREAWDLGLDPQVTKNLQAFSNGVNDFVQGVTLWPTSEHATARVLPPEFLAFGITQSNYVPWTPVDCLLMVKMISMHLTWNWSADL